MPLDAATPGWHGSFETIAAHGKAFVQKTMALEDNLLQGLDMSWEIFDAMDDLRIYTASGPLFVCESNTIVLSIKADGCREVIGPAFSVDSRDPPGDRWPCMDLMQYFRSFGRILGGTLPFLLRVRATVRCQYTGKSACIWDSGKTTRYDCKEVAEWDEEPGWYEGSYRIKSKSVPIHPVTTLRWCSPVHFK